MRSSYLNKDLLVPIYSNNTAAIALAKDPVAYSRIKHIEVRYYYIRQLVVYKKTILIYISTDKILIDILTKPLPNIAFQCYIERLLGPRGH
jgi:hypothetical protein